MKLFKLTVLGLIFFCNQITVLAQNEDSLTIYASNIFEANTLYEADRSMFMFYRQCELLKPEDAASLINEYIAASIEEKNRTAEVLFTIDLANILTFKSNNKETGYFLLLNAYEKAQASYDEKLIGLCAFSLGVYTGAFITSPKIDEAYKYMLIADKIFSKYGYENCYSIADKCFKIASILYQGKKYEQSKKYFYKVLNFSNQISVREVNNTYNTMGLIFKNISEYDSSIFWFNKCLTLSSELKDTTWIGLVTGNIGDVYLRMGDFEKSISCLEIDLKYSRGRLWYSGANAAQLLARINLQLGRFEKAKSMLDTARFYLSKDPAIRYVTLRDIELTSSELFTALNDYKNAHKHYLEYVRYSDTITAQFNLEKIAKYEFEYDIGIKQMDIELLKEQKKMESLKRNVLLSLIVILVVAAYFVYRNQRKRLQYEKEKAEQNRINLELKQKILTSQLEAEKQENDFNKRQLEQFTRNILEKSKLIEDLTKSTIMHEYPKTNQVDEHLLDKAAKELIAAKAKKPESHEDMDSVTIDNLSSLSGFRLLTDDDWTEFKGLFEKVYKGFFVKLKNTSWDLTVGETRLLALIKLKLETKEIANILAISPDSVKKSKQRLRRKLSISQDNSLEAIVLSI